MSETGASSSPSTEEMGSLLEVMLTERFGVGVQFLHGGTPARKRAEAGDPLPGRMMDLCFSSSL